MPKKFFLYVFYISQQNVNIFIEYFCKMDYTTDNIKIDVYKFYI